MRSPSGPIRPPELSELEALAVCAADGSLVAAAAKLGISRPAVSKRIANLEALVGKPLLHRGRRGVRLTDDGAMLLNAARRVLDERDVLMDALAEIRGDGRSSIAGLRELLGDATVSKRATQLPEARLADTERVLEIVMGASATGVAISDPTTSVFYEVNDAFCRIVGRARDQLLGRTALEVGIWYDPSERESLIERLLQSGELVSVQVRVKLPDGSVRLVDSTSRFVALAVRRRLVSTVDDVTDQREPDDGGAPEGNNGHRALVRVAALMLAGQPVLESIAASLPELRLGAGYACVALWDLEAGRPRSVAGGRLSDDLRRLLEQHSAAGESGILKLSVNAQSTPALAVTLPSTSHLLVLVPPDGALDAADPAAESLLVDLANLVAAQHVPVAR